MCACFAIRNIVKLQPQTTIVYIVESNENIPGGAEPHASHRRGDFIPAVNISLAETIFTLTGFTVGPQ